MLNKIKIIGRILLSEKNITEFAAGSQETEGELEKLENKKREP